MIYLRQSTASQEVPLGHFVDSTDGVTAETALTIANTDIKVWKTGATTLANKNSGGATHISGGIYYATLDATDTDTIGPLVIFVAVSGALAVRLECVVLDEAVYDHLFGTNPPLSPTVAGRTLDVTATGAAGIDLANVENPTTTLNLSGTTVKTATDVEADTADIQTRLPAALVSGRIDASVGAMSSGVVTAAAVATGAIDADALATDAVAEIADGVWDEAISGHLTGGTTGAALNAAGSAGDPWSTPLPGAYSSGTAGKILGDNLNATISSRASQTSLDTVDDFLDTEIAAIKAKTDNLPASPAATGDIPTAGTVADAVWDEALSGHTTSGSAGKSLADTEVDAAAVEVDTQDIQSRLPAALVSGRIDASVGAMASGVLTAAAIASDAITAAKIATGAVDADAIATDAANKIADHILRRNLGNVSTGDTEAFRSILGAIRKLVNKVAVSGSTLTVYKEDDSTSAGTQTVTTSGSASPITALDTN